MTRAETNRTESQPKRKPIKFTSNHPWTNRSSDRSRKKNKGPRVFQLENGDNGSQDYLKQVMNLK